MTLLLLLVAGIGCSNKVPVHGKVVLQDGSPLNTGVVLFQGDGILSRATIQPDGTFKASTEKNNDGIPPGIYKVYISGAMVGADPPKGDASSDGGIPEGDVKHLIDPKFSHPDNSGIVCEVKSGMELPYVIQVTAPK